MNSELVETFLKIVEYRQISLAANALFITQAGVSNRLNKLERHLGVKLINRVKGHSQITLTEYGEKFIPLAKQYLSIINSANQLKNEPHYDQLTVVTTNDICGLYLAPLIKTIHLSNPEIRLDIRCTDSENIEPMVNELQADIGLQPFKTSDPKLNATKIFSDPLVLVTKGNHQLSQQVSADDLDRHNEVFIKYNDEYAVWHNICWDQTIIPALATNTVTGAIPTLLTSDQWAIVPNQLVNLSHGDLKKHHLNELKMSMTLYAINVKNNVKKSVISQLLSLMKFCLAKTI
ncbi:LysR family transcriptional regulator [uncultured Limosilactobacillus sp.]|uniref:LysR family transcriptional regulator n=1 Tax=uncultured Limosilactobacillus sp. TaxID=2837629 RepID=UPI0025E890A9|nr:LysR family transcriptional regulator [uncultured Limosilactobacillus sp.]